MVKHIVLWNWIPQLSQEERIVAGEKVKSLLEPIQTLVPGALEIKVICEGLDTGNRDVALLSNFESEEALSVYQNHPAHIEAGKYIKSVTCNRACMDYPY